MNIVNVMSNQSIASTVRIAIDSLTTVTRKTNIVNAPAVAITFTMFMDPRLHEISNPISSS